MLAAVMGLRRVTLGRLTIGGENRLSPLRRHAGACWRADRGLSGRRWLAASLLLASLARLGARHSPDITALGRLGWRPNVAPFARRPLMPSPNSRPSARARALRLDPCHLVFKPRNLVAQPGNFCRPDEEAIERHEDCKCQQASHSGCRDGVAKMHMHHATNGDGYQGHHRNHDALPCLAALQSLIRRGGLPDASGPGMNASLSPKLAGAANSVVASRICRQPPDLARVLI